MSSIFTGKRGIRQQYEELTFTQIEGTTPGDKATAVLLGTMKQAQRWAYICNETNVPLQFYLVNPESPQNTGDYRLFWFAMSADSIINFGASSAPAWEIPAKTRIYALKESGTASSGKLRFTAFG